MSIKVIIVDDHAVSIAGAKALLASTLAEGSEVKGCPDPNLALTEILTWEPDVCCLRLEFWVWGNRWIHVGRQCVGSRLVG